MFAVLENINKLTLKKLDNPLRKNPKPPKLTAKAQKTLLNLREPSMYDPPYLLF